MAIYIKGFDTIIESTFTILDIGIASPKASLNYQQKKKKSHAKSGDLFPFCSQERRFIYRKTKDMIDES